MNVSAQHSSSILADTRHPLDPLTYEELAQTALRGLQAWGELVADLGPLAHDDDELLQLLALVLVQRQRVLPVLQSRLAGLVLAAVDPALLSLALLWEPSRGGKFFPRGG